VLALGACSDDDPEPKFAPTPSTSAPTEVTTSPTTAADEETEFVASYFKSIGEATTNGDTTAFVGVSSPDCTNCQTLARNIDRAFKGGSHVEGALWVIAKSVRAGKRPEGNVWNVDVTTARERWYDGSGELIKIVKPSTQKFGIIVAVDGGDFQVKDLRLR
jgi:hypothetical protein